MAVVCVCIIAHRSQQVVTYFVEEAFEKVLFATLATTLHTAKGQITSRLSEAVFKVDELFMTSLGFIDLVTTP